MGSVFDFRRCTQRSWKSIFTPSMSPDEKDELLKRNPELSRYVRPFVGADEFIKGKSRYCLWLEGVAPQDLIHSTELSRRIAAVRECRNASPWPEPSEAQRARIEQTAKAILDARAKYPESTLAALYNNDFMPADLLRAHQANDRAVMQAYGFPVKSTFTESQCVTELFKLYKNLTQ